MSCNKINIIEIHTDGSSLGNPGPSGLGYVIRYWEIKEENKPPVANEVEGSQGFKLSTNNRMEIMAVIYAINFTLELIDVGMLKDIKEVHLYTDSKYVHDSIVKKWIDKWSQNNWITSTQSSVKNKDLWESILITINNLNKKGIKLIINHIPGHQGFEFNERADALCTAASKDYMNQISDINYELLVSNNKK